MNQHGGKRKGAGRKEEISLMIQMSLMLRVAEIMRSRGIVSMSSALRILEKYGELPKLASDKRSRKTGDQRYKSYLKYLTPKLFDPRIRNVLLNAKREGIISLIPLQIPKYVPKNKK